MAAGLWKHRHLALILTAPTAAAQNVLMVVLAVPAVPRTNRFTHTCDGDCVESVKSCATRGGRIVRASGPELHSAA
jgi:hypothetical protein